MAGACRFIYRIEDVHKSNTVGGGSDAGFVAEGAFQEVVDFAFEDAVHSEAAVAKGLGIYEHTVKVGKDFYLRIELHTCFGTKELDFALIVLKVYVKGSFYLKGKTVIELDHSRCKIFYVVNEFALGGGNPILTAACTVGAKVVIGYAEHGNGLGAACKVTNKVDNVHAKVDKRTAACIVLIAEPAAGPTVTTKVASLCIIDIAHCAAIDKSANDRGILTKTTNEADHKKVTGFFGNSLHFFCFGSVHSHGLFAKNLTACAQCGNGCALVGRVPGTNRKSIDLFLCQHFVIIGIICGNRILLGILFNLFFVDIANSNNLALIGKLFVSTHMAMADTAGTDNGNS